MASPTTAQEEANSPEPPAKPSHHGRHANRAEERAGNRATGRRRVTATHTISQEVHGHDERSTIHDLNSGEQNQR